MVAWRALREREGAQATILDLYDLAAAARGVAVDQLPMAERQALGHAAMPEVWPGFALTENSERVGDVISVVDYDPRWPQDYKCWHRLLATCTGTSALFLGGPETPTSMRAPPPRTGSASRAMYAAAKRKAAVLWADDGIAYTDAKSDVIAAIVQAAIDLPTT